MQCMCPAPNPSHSQAGTRGWQFWVDRGGTFTDVIGLSPSGELHVRKVPSAAPGATGSAAIRGIRAIMGTPAPIDSLKVGTTVATNALLERAGQPVLLVTTAGFGDALRIGYQNRPDIFARRIILPDRLYCGVIEATERLDHRGRVLIPLATDALRATLEQARASGIRCVAIVFMHGWQFPLHEQEAAALARSVGFEEVSVSHELAPLVRFVARGDATVLNAYLALPVRRYVEELQRELNALDPLARLELMQSNGGLASPARFHAMSAVLSGPAGGLIGMRWIGRRLGRNQLIGFDMGGTSTDVSLLDGELPRRFEHLIGGVRLQTAMLDVHTIAAGGGSILRFTDGRCVVGPESAGASPGPACYGCGGPATLTDLQVLLGRLRPDTLPAAFGADGQSRIDPGIVAAEFARLAGEVGRGMGRGVSPEQLAESFLAVAVESMANSIRQMAARHGRDPGDFSLFCFGGAAGQHACRVAQAAGMQTVLIHSLASVLCALGIGVADRLAVRRASMRLPLDSSGLNYARERLQALEREARDELAPHIAMGIENGSDLEIERWLELRTGDSEATLCVLLAPCEQVLAAFSEAHERRFGFAAHGESLIIETVRVEARLPSLNIDRLRIVGPAPAALPASARVWFDEWQDVPVHTPWSISSPIEGPALIVEPHSTIVVEPGWRASRLPSGELLLEVRSSSASASVQLGSDIAVLPQHSDDAGPADPARIEIFNNLFMHIAAQMGEVLKATAYSVNIKERLDYSCALFDSRGGLVANAPHMPVHLGSMGASVRAVIDGVSNLRRGDVWLLNSPYHGGTHLPDMTVVTPVFLSAVGPPDFFVASRAHHADIGGITPGSMPPFSRTIEEEGVLFECTRLVEGGALLESQIRDALSGARYPARQPDQNIADLRAQIAANTCGIDEITRAVARHGLETVRNYMRFVQDNAAASVREAILRLREGSFRYEMDSGRVIAVRVDVDGRTGRARIDFAGTSAQDTHNFNAPRAVCLAAVLYVYRTLIDRSLPLNEGCLQPLEILIPAGSMLDPIRPAAVAAGNVETSQCIVDALYGALGELAASQGTMNNLTFGNDQLQYYETIAGGAGAGPGFDGCDAVQTHMTNSRLTDPEILEGKFPLLVREFSVRTGSGGKGRFRGGDGVVRRLQFLAPLSGALLANHRRIAPFGMAGGEPGATGGAWIRRASGRIDELGATAQFTVQAGDELTIVTPGGGGYGTVSSAS